MSNIHQLSDQRFGRLVTLGPVGERRRGQLVWQCRCDCGEIKNIPSYALTSGAVISCGCYGKAILGNATRTHGKTRTSEYVAWKKMRQRCTNPKDPKYNDYGGRGISICTQWESFDVFWTDMGPKPSIRHSIGRKDNDGNYEPTNCEWQTGVEQSNNTRSNRVFSRDGVSMTLVQWARKLNLSTSTITRRIRRGVPPQEALR